MANIAYSPQDGDISMISDRNDPPQVLMTLGNALSNDESRSIEYKEVKGQNPVRAIVNAADEYAVAFLNSDGGRILWGVRDHDQVITGVRLTVNERDKLRKDVSAKLHSIQPAVDPTRFQISIHALGGTPAGEELFVVELIVPSGDSADPYYTGSHEAFARVDGVKKKLSGTLLTAWIKTRFTKSISGSSTVTDPNLLSLATRVRRILSNHGLEHGHIARFFKLREAPFGISLSDLQSDDAFLRWLTEEKIDWIASTFRIRREWIDGEDGRVHCEEEFDKQPGHFFSTMSRHLDALIFEEVPFSPEACFIRCGQGRDWERKGNSEVFFVLAVPLARLSNERVIFKYVSDFVPYPWSYPWANIQLRAWARLLAVEKNVYSMGYEIPHKLGRQLRSNCLFLYQLLERDGGARRIDWHLEDYGLSERESGVAKGTETLPDVLEFLRSHNLPISERIRPRNPVDRTNGQEADPS